MRELDMNAIKEKENDFLKLISDTVTDIVGGKKLITPTNLKIKYRFRNMSKIKVNVFFDNDKSGKTGKKNNIINFLVTPENKLDDVHVDFGSCTNFDLSKEKLKKFNFKVKEKIDSLFKMSDLTYAKVRALTENEKKTSLDKLLDLLNVTLEDIDGINLWLVDGEVYSVPSGVLIEFILSSSQVINCYINRDNEISLDSVNQQLDRELGNKLPDLLKNSELDFKKLNKIAQKMGKKRADLLGGKLVYEYYHKDRKPIEKVKAPSEEFKKFKKFEKSLNEFLQKIVEGYDGLKISIEHIEYTYPARIEVWSGNSKIISFNMNPYSHDDSLSNIDHYDDSLLDVDVSLEKCLSNGVSYGDLQEENIKVRKALPRLLFKADLHFSDVEKWNSFEYPATEGPDAFAKHLYNYLSQFDIINADLLQHMYFGCNRPETNEITVEIFSGDPYGNDDANGVSSLLRFTVYSDDAIYIDGISCKLIKNYKRLSSSSYRELLDILDVMEEEIVFLLKYYLCFDYWNNGFPSTDYPIAPDPSDEMYDDYLYSLTLFEDGSLGDRVFRLNEFYKYGLADELEPIEDTNDEG